ncbi:MAG: hypothetical protein ACI4S4_07240 [Candidatus Ornithospirochaeta sp.]
MYDEETLEFIKEREEKLGNPLLWRNYATWFAEVGGERREFGVFMYSDGKTMVFEDFFRPAKVLGYEIETKREKERKKEYRKMEIVFPVSSISSVSMVLKSKAEKALRDGVTDIPEAKGLGKLLFRTVAMLKAEGRTFFFEAADYKKFKETFMK